MGHLPDVICDLVKGVGPTGEVSQTSLNRFSAKHSIFAGNELRSDEALI